jgi:hypothetical protein
LPVEELSVLNPMQLAHSGAAAVSGDPGPKVGGGNDANSPQEGGSGGVGTSATEKGGRNMKGISLRVQIDLFDKPQTFTVGADVSVISQYGLINILEYLNAQIKPGLLKYIQENELNFYKMYADE